MNRRRFIRNGIVGSLAASQLLPKTLGATTLFDIEEERFFPDFKKRFASPVIIDSVDLLRVKDTHFVVATSMDGAKGFALTNSRLTNTTTLFNKQVASFFKGKDARDIEAHVLDELYLYRRNYKYAGMPLWNSVAHAEIAILDMLGRIAGIPSNQLIGAPLRSEVDVYMSSTERGTTAGEEVAWVDKRIQETNSKAVKLKIGGRMSRNADVYPGRSEDLIKLSRKTWGDDFTIYFDANSTYDVPHAIEMGRMLEDYGIGLFEEPVSWEDFDATKQVADALDMPVAGGEQDSSLPKWIWMINNRAVDICQPDLLYNGGFARTLRIAKLCERAGMDCTLHSPKNDPLAAYALHFVSLVPNIGPYQEFRAMLPEDESYFTPKLRVKNGKIGVPTGPGFGIDFDPDYLAKAKKV